MGQSQIVTENHQSANQDIPRKRDEKAFDDQSLLTIVFGNDAENIFSPLSSGAWCLPTYRMISKNGHRAAIRCTPPGLFASRAPDRHTKILESLKSVCGFFAHVAGQKSFSAGVYNTKF